MSNLVNGIQYKKRIIDSKIDKYLKVCGAICIEGPKWCGKTCTSSYHSKSEYLVGDPTNNFSNRHLAEINPSLILEGENTRMIDEWQEVPSIWDATRATVDKRQDKGLFILTGSSTPRKKGVLHSGTGRIVNLRMNTMSLYESGDSDGSISLKDVCDGKYIDKLIETPDLEKLAYYIVRGGWPENIRTDLDNCYIMPRAYMEGVINEDLNKLDDGGFYYDPHKIKLLLQSLARNEATTVSDSKILSDIIENDKESMSRNTISKYLDALNRLFLFNNQSPFGPGVRSTLRVKQMEKRHFSDPAMAAALLGLNPKKMLSDLNTFGFLFEALVERDLSIYADSFNGKLYHYQNYNNEEIDAVIELEDGEWCAFEIKLGANKEDEAAANLIKVCDNIEKSGGKKPKVKCVICGVANSAHLRPDGVYVLPITCLKN